MSLRIYVDAYSGYRANERPRQLCLDDDVFEIADVDDRWYDPDAEYFKVRTVDGRCFLLRCDAASQDWTLQSGCDGAALLARPSIELITVEPAKPIALEVTGPPQAKAIIREYFESTEASTNDGDSDK